MPSHADEPFASIETLGELAGFDVLPDSYRVRDDVAIPDGYVVVRSSGWQDTSSPPAPPRDAMDARRLERTARWAGARPRRQFWAALAWREVRRFRRDSRALLPSWSPRRTASRPRTCGSRRIRRRAGPRQDAGAESGVEGDSRPAGGGCSWL
jgi:hypothetical protein